METQGAGGRDVFVARLVLGLLQGLLLYGLYYAFDHKAWPATAPLVFAPALLVALYGPLLVLQALGNLKARTLIPWAVVAVIVAAGFGFYDIWHAWPEASHEARPSGQVIVFTAVFLFVSHALVTCIAEDGKLVPAYPTLFDVAWKLGVQVAIAACFVGAFWIILWLGVGLFEMIKLHFFRDFINHAWFAIPVTAMATAVSIHITDVRSNLVRGVRTLALMLLGWLLPVAALIAFAFLVSLVFTGLRPLWETRTATALLLVAAAVLVVLINAAYQDGNPEQRPHHVLRLAGTLASIELIFIVAIAAYALWLRVDQYGWTVDRIDTAGVTLVAMCFAIGYLIAALLPSPWLKLIETWNYLTTILGLAVLFALFTPIADPMRLSVASQMARLKAGVVKPAAFDFAYLRWHGGRFGHEALVALSASKDKEIGPEASNALKESGPYFPRFKPTAQSIAAKIIVHPSSKSLPESFLKQDWGDAKLGGFSQVAACVNSGGLVGWRCDAIIRDFDGDGAEEILLLYGPDGDGPYQYWNGYLFKREAQRWDLVASFGSNCAADRKALVDNRYVLARPVLPLPDILVGTRRLQLVPLAGPVDCP